jgi:hypothetical protein
MEYALVALAAPSNIEKKVRELQSSLYHQSSLASALSLPVMIPLCFVAPAVVPAKRDKLRDGLRRAIGKEAPYLSSKSIAETSGFLFWELAPRPELQRRQRSCERVFGPENAQQAEQQEAERPDLFPLSRGFFLCSLQGRPLAALPSLTVPESFIFPAKAAFLLHIHTLAVETGSAKDTSCTENRPWWGSLFWEKLEEIPLRKSRAAG